MVPESLSLLQQAVRINPSVTVSALAADKTYGEALIDVYVGVGDAPLAWDVTSWDAALEEIDSDARTIADFVATPEVQKAIRALEATHG